MTIEAKKYHLLELITDIQDENMLAGIELMLKEFIVSSQKVVHVGKPIRQNLLVEDLAQEQDYQGIEKKKFDRLIGEIHVEEPIEDLLRMV